jgi:hypothetical protein
MTSRALTDRMPTRINTPQDRPGLETRQKVRVRLRVKLRQRLAVLPDTCPQFEDCQWNGKKYVAHVRSVWVMSTRAVRIKVSAPRKANKRSGKGVPLMYL